MRQWLYRNEFQRCSQIGAPTVRRQPNPGGGLPLGAPSFSVLPGAALVRRVAVAIALVCLLTIARAGYCAETATGGLDAPETGYSLGPNLLVNGDLRSGVQGWTFDPTCFSLDGSGDNASLNCRQPCGQQYPSAKNDLKCPPGLYTISAEIKTQTNITLPKRRWHPNQVAGDTCEKMGDDQSAGGYDRLDSSDESACRGRRWQRWDLPSRTRWDRSLEHHGSENFSSAARFPRRSKPICSIRTIGE